MRSIVVAAIAIVVCAPVSAGGLADKMPRVVHSVHGGPPLWVPASEALTPDGELRAEYFDPVRLQRLEQNRARNSDRCTSYLTGGASMELPLSSTLEERIARAYTIAAGEVSAAEDGFYGGTPGAVYTLRVTERLKMFGHSPASERLYLFVAGTDISTARGHICSTAGPGGVLPHVGDRLIVIAHLPAQDAGRHFVPVDPRLGLIISRGSTLLGAPALDGSVTPDLPTILRRIERSDGIAAVPARAEQ